MAEILKITSDNFEKEVAQSDKPVVVDFWASWCGPCRMFAPSFEACAQEMDDVRFGKVNIDEEGDIAAKYRVMSIPTVAVMKNGQIVEKSVGAISKEELKTLIESAK